MIVFRLLLGEVLKSQLAVFSILMVVFVSREFVSILGDASEGKIAGTILFQLIGLNLPQLANMLLPMSFFLGILLAYGRMYAESEMVVLKATGISEWYVTRVTLILGAVFCVLAGALAVVIGPNSKAQEMKLLEQAKSDTNVHALVEGQFRKSQDGSSVIFVEQISNRGNLLETVFMAQMPENWEKGARGNVVLAKQGVFKEQSDGRVNLILSSGERYEGSPTQADYERVTFDSYTIDAQTQTSERKRRKLDATPTSELLGSDAPEMVAELHWRLAVPLSIPILTLIAVPLAAVNPRQGMFAKMLPAILLYLGYYILLVAGRKALESEAIPSMFGLWWVHLMGLIWGGILLINGRESGARFKALLRRAR